MRPDSITKEIRSDFSDADKLQMAADLTKKLADIEQVESEKKSAAGIFNERQKSLEAEVESLWKRYNKGYEMAQIGCDIRYNDPTPGQKSIYRMDTATLVETVEMSWEEKQEELQFNLPSQTLCGDCGHTRDQHKEEQPCKCDVPLGSDGMCRCDGFREQAPAPPDDLEKAMGISGEPSEPIPPRITEVPPDQIPPEGPVPF